MIRIRLGIIVFKIVLTWNRRVSEMCRHRRGLGMSRFGVAVVRNHPLTGNRHSSNSSWFGIVVRYRFHIVVLKNIPSLKSLCFGNDTGFELSCFRIVRDSALFLRGIVFIRNRRGLELS